VRKNKSKEVRKNNSKEVQNKSKKCERINSIEV